MNQLLQTIALVELFDVALVAVFFYALILWLRQGTSGHVAGRAVLLAFLFGGIYFLARALGLFMVERLLQLLMIAYLLITVVVFQADVRRLLNRAAPWRFLSSDPAPPTDILTDLLAESVTNLAATKTGALIALKGQEPWDDFVHGGVTLDGEPSQPLFYSLFNADTPGHDGAVLVEGGRVSKFATHLPLATNLPEASRYGGTRHAAALGLSERCDALVIVVSEERGTMSIAQGNHLEEVPSASELKQRITSFMQARTPVKASGPRLRLLHPPTALLSLGLASMLWLFLAYSPNQVYRNVEVPLEFRNLPDGWELTDTNVSTVRVTLAASEQVFELFDPRNLVLSLNLANSEAGKNTFTVSSDNLRLPSRVRLHSADPPQVTAETWPLSPVEVPVVVQTLGFLPASLLLVRVVPEPTTFTLLLPQGQANNISQVLTEPIDLSNVTLSETLRTNLIVPSGGRLPSGSSPQVDVRVDVQAR